MGSISVDDDLHRQLRRIAEGEKRSPDAVLRDAIREYAERLKAKADFLEEAQNAWAGYQEDRLHLTGNETREWLKRWGNGSGAEPPDCHD